MDIEALKRILLDGNYISKEDLKKAEDYAKARRGDPLEFLLAEGIITRDLLGQAIAEALGLDYADLNSAPPSREQVLKIPEEVALNHRVVLFAEKESKGKGGKKTITITADDPLQDNLKIELEKVFPGQNIILAYSLPEDIDAALLNYRQALDTRFSKIATQMGKFAPEMIAEIVSDALAFRASDIHFDAQEKEVVIRFRVDGVLREAGRLSKDYYENILNRIKVQAHLRTDEHYSAQDGAIRYQIPGSSKPPVDMRVSIVPTLDGEKIVIRLLAEYTRGLTLADLGLSPDHQRMIAEAANKPFGMILVTGPTGSGKTTTLYALLKTLNDPEVNIATIEDPVEYKIVGVNHIQVNTQTNLTFAQGLRSIVRQDPDIILVGEVRDRETAEISINAALTGHLLLSTFHANDAATAIPRLLDMGLEPFLLSSTLEVVVAQRLVRRLCEQCRYSVVYDQAKLKKSFPTAAPYFKDKRLTLYQGKGCQACAGSGYRGRVAIFEFITMTPELRDLILKRPASKQIWEIASKRGAQPLFFDGLDKVRNGLTTLDELLRVAEPPEKN